MKKTIQNKCHIHTILSETYYNILKKYTTLSDKEGNKIFGTQAKVIEKALEMLDRHYNPKKSNVLSVWCRARDELNMVLVGKTTFLAYISGNYKKAYKNNIAIEAIEWFLGKRKEEINLEEFLNGLKGMWEVANYFYKIDIIKNENDSFQMNFKHDLNKKYGEYWSCYFKTILEKNFKCSVEIFLRNESFYLIIIQK